MPLHQIALVIAISQVIRDYLIQLLVVSEVKSFRCLLLGGRVEVGEGGVVQSREGPTMFKKV